MRDGAREFTPHGKGDIRGMIEESMEELPGGMADSSRPLNPEQFRTPTPEYKMEKEDAGQLEQALGEMSKMIEQEKPVDFSAVKDGLAQEGRQLEKEAIAALRAREELKRKIEMLEERVGSRDITPRGRIIAMRKLRSMEEEMDLQDKFLLENGARYGRNKNELRRIAQIVVDGNLVEDQADINLVSLRGQAEKTLKPTREQELAKEQEEILNYDTFGDNEGVKSIRRMNEVAALLGEQEEERWGSKGIRKLALEMGVPLGEGHWASTKKFEESFGEDLSSEVQEEKLEKAA